MDWVRGSLYAVFILIFSAGMHSSFSRLFERKTAFSQEQRTSAAIQYPSVTICPGWTADQKEDWPKDRVNDSINDYLLAFIHKYQDGNRFIPTV